jgi:hypothetical protein
MSNLKPEEDYLDEDKPLKQLVKKQNYCVVSMLTPNCFPENKREEYKDQKILGIKIRGVFETYEEAKIQSEKLQKLDKFHNIFIGEVGKWLPFDVDIAKMETEEDPVYREKSLNQYMKAYKDCLKEEEVSEKERKEEQLKGAKVVTGKTDAPLSTGIGCTEMTSPGIIPNQYNDDVNDDINDGTTLEQQRNKINEYTNYQDDDEEEISSTIKNKIKLEDDLESSKNNLKDLEAKLSTINQIYAELKK